MIRAALPLGSFVALGAFGREFFNSLGYERTFPAAEAMSPLER